MPSYTAPTSSGLGVSLSHYIDWSGVRAGLFGLLGLGLISFGLAAVATPALAADEARPTDLVVGDAKAVCTVIEFSSLACSHCAHFHETIYPTIRKDFIDTGKVRMIFRDFPLNKWGFIAAKVARCSGPIKRLGFQALFFQTQKSWIKPEPEMMDEIISIARRGGMSKEQVDMCMTDKAVEQAILSDNQEGIQKYNVSGTPTFIMNGKVAESVNGTTEEFIGNLKKNCGL